MIINKNLKKLLLIKSLFRIEKLVNVRFPHFLLSAFS